MLITDVIAQTGRVFTADDISVATLPTTTGQIQILPTHENLLTTLDTGIVTLVSKSRGQYKVTVASGFAQIVNNQLTILVDYADLASELVAEKIQAAITAAEQKISGSLQPAELIQLEKILRYEKFKQKLLSQQ